MVLNVANDILVEYFLSDKIQFLDIPNIIEETLSTHDFIKDITLDDINYLKGWTQQYIKEEIHD